MNSFELPSLDLTIPLLTVSVYTRHSPTCAHKEDKEYRRCRCPKWLYINENGKDRRVSAKTRSWDGAERKRRDLEYMLDPRNKREAQLRAEEERKRVSIEEAVDAFLADARARKLAKDTCTKLETIFRKQMLGWSKAQGFTDLAELTTAQLTTWRSTWKDEALASRKKHERVISFFNFCTRQGWMPNNPAKALTRIVVKQKPTDYFPTKDFDHLVDCTYIYDLKSRNKAECCNQAERLRVLVLLMRWSGLRIRDAVTLERARLHGDSVLLYQAKTGTPVYVPLPPDVADCLRNVPPGPAPNPRYFFWSGNGDPRSAVKDWQRSFTRLFKIAALKNEDGTAKRSFAHMLRDTFAVENLLAGMPLDQVSLLLGHGSVTITEKHYAPFVRARQQQIESSVRAAWKAQGIPNTARAKVVTIERARAASATSR